MPTVKNATKKTTIVDEVINEPETNVVVEKNTKPRKIADDEYIECKAMKNHRVIFIGAKSKDRHEFSGFGDICSIQYQDLRACVTGRTKDFLFDPCFIILDDDVLAQPQFKKLKEMYDKMYVVEDVDELFNMRDIEFKAKLLAANEGLKELILSSATQRLKEGTFNSITKLRMIDEVFHTGLKEFI